jgi:transcriptional regulator of acetoin/glycerol metabolism
VKRYTLECGLVVLYSDHGAATSDGHRVAICEPDGTVIEGAPSRAMAEARAGEIARGRIRVRTLAEIQDRAARLAIRWRLRAHSGNVRLAARSLGVDPSTLHRQIDRLGLREWLTEEYERAARQPPR